MITLPLSLEQYVKLRSLVAISHYHDLFSRYLKVVGEVKRVIIKTRKNRAFIHFTDETQKVKFMLKYL